MVRTANIRACLKKAFCKMCVTICGRFHPDEGAVAGYGNRIRMKYTAKWGVQIAGMIFQTRSGTVDFLRVQWTEGFARSPVLGHGASAPQAQRSAWFSVDFNFIWNKLAKSAIIRDVEHTNLF